MSPTNEPLRAFALHFGGQAIPAALVTCPRPLTLTLRVGPLAKPPANASAAVARARTPTSDATRIAGILRPSRGLGKGGLLFEEDGRLGGDGRPPDGVG